MKKFQQDEADILAAMIHWRFGGDLHQSLAAWNRLLEVNVWNDLESMVAFEEMIERGNRFLRDTGLR
jgi:hypothetical protein